MFLYKISKKSYANAIQNKKDSANTDTVEKNLKTSKSIPNPKMALPIYHDYESSNDVTKFLEILGKIKQELKINSFYELTNYLENL